MRAERCAGRLTEVVRLREAYEEDAARTPLIYRERKKRRMRSRKLELVWTAKRRCLLGRAKLADVICKTRGAAKQMTNDFGIEFPRRKRLSFEDAV